MDELLSPRLVAINSYTKQVKNCQRNILPRIPESNCNDPLNPVLMKWGQIGSRGINIGKQLVVQWKVLEERGHRG